MCSWASKWQKWGADGERPEVQLRSDRTSPVGSQGGLQRPHASPPPDA